MNSFFEIENVKLSEVKVPKPEEEVNNVVEKVVDKVEK